MNAIKMNAALWSLVEGDLSALGTVIWLAQDIPISERWSLDVSGQRNESSSFTGQTDQGSVNFSQKEEGLVSKNFGVRRTRIGHFKLERCRFEGYESISFPHYWASDDSTRGLQSEPITYQIRHKLANLAPIIFGTFEQKEIFSFWVFRLVQCYIHPIPSGDIIFGGMGLIIRS